MRCEVITSRNYLSQSNIDEWLSKGDFEIVSQTQSQDNNGNITLVIFYIDLQEKRDRKITSIIN